MHKNSNILKIRSVLLFFLILNFNYCLGWGFFGHKLINQKAVFTLPPEMFGFYKKHIDYISTHSVDPDKRRYASPDEAPRHYIDIDRYGSHPFDSLPVYWKEAVRKYGEDSLKEHGIVPWHIEFMMYRLTAAFKEKNVERILQVSAELGHYIADAHVPLHCTSNYNGQKTNQKGIHGLWESRLPELFSNSYDFLTGRCRYIEKTQKEAWSFIKASFAAHDSVLSMERQVTKRFSADRKYSYERRGNSMVKVYSVEFSSAYHKILDGMVERRMADAILATGNFWYTAWVNAGAPDLNDLIDAKISDEFIKNLEEEIQSHTNGKTIKSHGHSDD